MPILVKHHNVWKSVTAGSSVDINLDTSSPLGAPDWDEVYATIEGASVPTVVTYSKDATHFRIEYLFNGDIPTAIEYYISGDSGASFTLLGTKHLTYLDGVPTGGNWVPNVSES